MPRRLLTVLTLTAALSGAAACGDGNDQQSSKSNADFEQPNQSEQSAETIPASDLERIIQAEDSVATTCGLTEDEAGSDMPLPEAIQILARAYRSYPEGTFGRPNDESPRSMKKVVEQNAAMLRDCGKSAEATRLQDVVKS